MEKPSLSDAAMLFLAEIRKWARFIAIVMFVMIGLMVVLGFAMGSIMDSLSTFSDEPGMPMSGPFFAVTYILMAVLYFFPALYLYRFTENLGKAMVSGSEQELTTAFDYLKRHYKFVGILLIISLAFIALAFLIAIFAAIFGIAAGTGV